mgnify:CR=1 FL=1
MIAFRRLTIRSRPEKIVKNAQDLVPAIEKDSAAIKSGVSSETIQSVPVGQEYRDLIKLIPGVQYTQDSVRGPSAGGSGQDNVYKFDGVNVTLPLFGTLQEAVSQAGGPMGGGVECHFDVGSLTRGERLIDRRNWVLPYQVFLLSHFPVQLFI